MHPALHTQVVVRAAYQAHVLSHQIAAQTQLYNRMRASAALLALADRYLCELSEVLAVALAVTTVARSIKISARQQQHILERRAVAAKVDADLAAYRIADALSNARYFKRPSRVGRFEIIGEVPRTGRHLLVALKLVPSEGATSGEDEWWVVTAIPLGKRKLRQLINTNQLTVLPNGVA